MKQLKRWYQMDKLPQNWSRVKFGDVVKRVKDQVPNRDEWDFDRYIGGEHFGEGEIRVTKFAPIEGNEEVIGSAFRMRFKPGHVLYVSRNPRLRKGGIVDFEGVCSDVTYVMQADETKLLQSLLPFIIQTEDFIKHTTNHAHGSTNPFLNWKDLASYVFFIPDMEKQKEISKTLWRIENNIKITEKYLDKLRFFNRKAINDLLIKGISHNNFKKTKMGEIPRSWDLINFIEVTDKEIPYSFTGGPFGSDLKFKDYTKEGIRIIQLQNIGDGFFNNDYKLYTSKEKADELKNCNIYPGEIIISKMADPIARACFIPDYEERYVMCSDGIRIVVDEDRFDKKFILYSINSKYFRNQAIMKSTGSTRLRIGLTTLKKLKIRIPRLEEQIKIRKIIEKMELSINRLEKYYISNKELRNKLMNEKLREL
jgi:type I restriction enzyme, S subunit